MEFERTEKYFKISLEILGNRIRLNSGGKQNMSRLNRLVKDSKNVREFVETVLHFLSWYQIPITWNKENLKLYYYSKGGK